MPETTSYQRFRARVESLQQHLQVVDLGITKLFTLTQNHPQAGITILGALDVNSQRYDRLNHPATHNARIFNFSRSRNIEHALISLYRYFSEYMRGVLGEIYQHNPLMVVGKAPGSLQYAEIVKLGNFDDLASEMVDKVFRRLEDERSTVKLLDKVLNHTGVQLNQGAKDDALRYLEMRHLFIHNHGRVDAAYVSRFGAVSGLNVGDRMPTRFRVASDAIEAVDTLLMSIDEQLINGNLAAPR